MKKILVVLFSMTLLAVVLVCYLNHDGPDEMMSGGTLVSSQMDI